MKAHLLFVVLLALMPAALHAQLVFPKEFRLVDGGNYAGDNDEYTNGVYTFDTHKLFRDFDFGKNDARVQRYVQEFFGFPFYLTKDGLCWGTGLRNGVYSYVIVTWEAEVLELYAARNDAGFSRWSTWLLQTVRAYRRKGRMIMFPMRQLPDAPE